MFDLKAARKKAGLTQSALAEQARINIRHLQKMESGEIQLENITLSTAACLAKALGINIDNLLSD